MKNVLVLMILTYASFALATGGRRQTHNNNPNGGHAEGSGFTPPHATNPGRASEEQTSGETRNNLSEFDRMDDPRLEPLFENGLGGSEEKGYIGVSQEALAYLLDNGKLPVLPGGSSPDPSIVGFQPSVDRDGEFSEEEYREIAIGGAVNDAQNIAKVHGFLSLLGLNPFDSANYNNADNLFYRMEEATYAEAGDQNAARRRVEEVKQIFRDKGFSDSAINDAVALASERQGYVVAIGQDAMDAHNADIQGDRAWGFLTPSSEGITLNQIMGIGYSTQWAYED